VASLELRNQTYRVVFMHGGRKFGYSLDTADRQTAEALKGGVEKTLMLIGQGALDIPDGGTSSPSSAAAARPPSPRNPPRQQPSPSRTSNSGISTPTATGRWR
jgi:hypothetical protein